MEEKNAKIPIVLIEDDPFLAEIYSTRLEEEGFLMYLVKDGEMGIDLLKNMKPALVLLDVVLPNMDGFSLLEQIKNTPELKGIPVVLLTNLGQKEDIERGMRLGATAYLVKANFTPTEVVAKVKEILGIQ